MDQCVKYAVKLALDIVSIHVLLIMEDVMKEVNVYKVDVPECSPGQCCSPVNITCQGTYVCQLLISMHNLVIYLCD